MKYFLGLSGLVFVGIGINVATLGLVVIGVVLLTTALVLDRVELKQG